MNLGALYGHGTKEEQRKAVALYRKAAEKGFRIGQYNLGYVYLHGKGVEKDEAQAANWVRKAAEQGLSEAQLLLGEMYRDGQGVKRDRVQAWAWFDTSSANDMNPFAAQNSIFLEKKMTAEERAQAKVLSKQYVEKYAPEAWARIQKLKTQSAPIQ